MLHNLPALLLLLPQNFLNLQERGREGGGKEVTDLKREPPASPPYVFSGTFAPRIYGNSRSLNPFFFPKCEKDRPWLNTYIAQLRKSNGWQERNVTNGRVVCFEMRTILRETITTNFWGRKKPKRRTLSLSPTCLFPPQKCSSRRRRWKQQLNNSWAGASGGLGWCFVGERPTERPPHSFPPPPDVGCSSPPLPFLPLGKFSPLCTVRIGPLGASRMGE